MTSLTDEILALMDGTRSSEAWLDLAERAFVDTVAVLVAGSTESAVGSVRALVDEHGGSVRSVATGDWTSARSAALLDGTSAHVLDFDDVDDELVAHPSAVLVPALLAAGQQLDVDGRAVLDAYRVGLEAARAIGRQLDVPTHYAAGWHSSGTIGTVAAAAALAHLHGLDPLSTRHALGIAGSLAGGSRQNFGTMTKPLHVGMAASQGLSAVGLAATGFTADPEQLDGPLGFLALHRAPGAPTTMPATATTDGAPHGLDLKLFPCCYATHTAIEAAQSLRGRGVEDIVSVDAVMQPGGSRPLIHHRPADGTQAKFSLEYAVAVALLDGDVTLATFSDERARRPDVQGLLRRVDVTELAVPEPDRMTGRHTPWYAGISIRYTDGSTATAEVANPLGHASRPLTEAQLRAKFDDCLGTRSAESAFTSLRRLREQPSVRAVVAQVVDAASSARAGSEVGR